MARFCFLVWGGGGNVTATLPIISRLLERGHDVDVLGDATLRADVDPGATFVPFRRVPLNDSRDPSTDAIRDWDGRTPFGAMVRGYRWMFGTALAAADDLVEWHGEHPADVVVVDTMLPGGLIGAEAVGARTASLVHTAWALPVAGSVPLFAPLTPGPSTIARLSTAAARAVYARVFEATKRPLNRKRMHLGLAPIGSSLEQFLRSDRLLVLTSASFDFVPARLPTHAVYVGAPSPRPSAAGWQPPHGEAPLVLVALSTTFQDQGSLLARVADALGQLRVRGVITSGAIDPAAVPSPANVTVVRHVPHVDVLPHAAAVVTHAGHGTALAALTHGVPLLCLPHGRDQPGIAARVVHAGAGLRMSKRATADKIAEPVRMILEDTRYRVSAQRLAAAIAREGDPTDRAADELEALL